MTSRTTRSSVTFNEPFMLSAWEDLLPAGTYHVETEELVVEGNERTVYVRTATLLRISSGSSVQTVAVDPAELEAALIADKSPDRPL